MNNIRPINFNKFIDPKLTNDGKMRAHVSLKSLEILWVNTGTICNLTCKNCYIESSPTNDRLVYISDGEVAKYLDEINDNNMPTSEIAFTGGEPFMNPDIIAMLDDCLSRGHAVLILTNAMKPMHHKKYDLLNLYHEYGDKISIRVSVDHYTSELHEAERGKNSWQSTIDGIKWLSQNGFNTHVAGRSMWSEDENQMRLGFEKLFIAENIKIDAFDDKTLVIFPEMDAISETPEITTDCWGILNKSPDDIMCAKSRMVVKRFNADKPSVVACTLLPYDLRFDLGASLKDADKKIPLNHSYCAKFCVLGGGSCS